MILYCNRTAYWRCHLRWATRARAIGSNPWPVVCPRIALAPVRPTELVPGIVEGPRKLPELDLRLIAPSRGHRPQLVSFPSAASRRAASLARADCSRLDCPSRYGARSQPNARPDTHRRTRHRRPRPPLSIFANLAALPASGLWPADAIAWARQPNRLRGFTRGFAGLVTCSERLLTRHNTLTRSSVSRAAERVPPVSSAAPSAANPDVKPGGDLYLWGSMPRCGSTAYNSI